MAEHPSSRIDPEDFRWASVSQAEVADPSSGLKDAGYPDAATPANEEHNSQWYQAYLALLHLYGQVPRLFPTLGEALDHVDGTASGVPVVDGERFLVDGLQQGGIALSVGDILLQVAPGNPVNDLACDGQRVFSAVGSAISAHVNLGSSVSGWSQSPGSPNIAAHLDADALHVYASYATSNNIYLLDPTDGSTVATLTPTGPVTDVAANGVHLVFGDGTNAQVYNSLGASPSSVGTAAHGASVTAVALDGDQGYLCGTASSGFTVRSFALSSPGSFLWSVGLPGAGTPTDIKADGAYVYVTTLTGGHTVWCLRRTDGAIVWASTLDNAAQSVVRCAVDHRYLWVTDNADVGYALDKASGTVVWQSSDEWVVGCADGHQAFGAQTSGSYFIRGRRTAELRPFVVTLPTSAARRPFPRRAIPIAEPPLGQQDVIAEIAEATGDTTTSSATDVLMPSMTLTPAAGWYRVLFSGSVSHDSATQSVWTSIYAGGVQVAASERVWTRGNNNDNSPYACSALVYVSGSQAIEGQWRTSAATATAHQRQLLIERV